VFQADRFVVPSDISFQEIKRTYSLVKPEPGLSVTLENLFFDHRSSILRSESFLELDQLAEFLKENPELRIEIGGHTDSTGSQDFNVRLSVERAEAVRAYLASTGSIDQARLESRGYGDTRPVATNDTPAGRQQNRRVELIIAQQKP
jgi:outer membrane protein OmpA-like peptidoglycan-associated protein